jgi:hypothetical protein
MTILLLQFQVLFILPFFLYVLIPVLYPSHFHSSFLFIISLLIIQVRTRILDRKRSLIHLRLFLGKYFRRRYHLIFNLNYLFLLYLNIIFWVYISNPPTPLALFIHLHCLPLLLIHLYFVFYPAHPL